LKIALSGRVTVYEYDRVRTYFTSIWDSLLAHGHDVKYIRNTEPDKLKNIQADLLLDIDCGRGGDGNLRFIADSIEKIGMPSAVLFTDSHGYPTLHRRLAKKYDHVFYAVWDKRELFDGHPSAHWLPNFTDLKYFDGPKYADVVPEFDFGMFGSKHGLKRADPMTALCAKHGWTYDVREIGRQFKHRWPRTGMAMGNCKCLFNHGQKHDLNLRVFESMAIGRCLINDDDDRSGIDNLFIPWVHYVPYTAYSYDGLEEAMLWCMNNQTEAAKIASTAYEEVSTKHTVHNRVETILEIVGGGKP